MPTAELTVPPDGPTTVAPPGDEDVGGGTGPGGGSTTDGSVGTGGGTGGTASGSGGQEQPPPQQDTDGSERVGVDDLAGVGANGRAMLRGEWPTLVVEVDVQEGLDPDPSALDHLIATIEANVDKPGGIVTAGGNRFASDRTTWDSDALREVAAENRSNFSQGDAVALYVLYVRGRFEQEDAIGVAVNASEFAVFPQRWRGSLSQLLGGGTAVERAVLVHEAGHLFGLVNLTYRSQFDREDPDHPGHSSDRGSVMYWAIESTAIGQVFEGPPPDDFDDRDRADLRYLRTGSY